MFTCTPCTKLFCCRHLTVQCLCVQLDTSKYLRQGDHPVSLEFLAVSVSGSSSMSFFCRRFARRALDASSGRSGRAFNPMAESSWLVTCVLGEGDVTSRDGFSGEHELRLAPVFSSVSAEVVVGDFCEELVEK